MPVMPCFSATAFKQVPNWPEAPNMMILDIH
jgi:hypothetical protein